MNETYRFGPFQLDLPNRKLMNEGRPVPLTPKVFQTLEILLSNRDRVVSKQELLSAIWPEAHVEEANLTQNISVLRKALGETSSANKFIVTFPKQGYRFIGAVEQGHDLPEPPPEPSAAPTRGFRYAWLACFAALPLAAFSMWRLAGTASPTADVGPLPSLTHLPGRAYQPVLSPAGGRVAFVSHQTASGPLRIGFLDLAPSSVPHWLATGEDDAFSPAWSPDGKRLAYLRAVGANVSVIIQQPGAAPQYLTDIAPESCGVVARQLDWSPDGRFLAVSTRSAADEPFRIELIHIVEKRKTVLTAPPELSDGDFAPRFSPDGTKVAFVRQISIGNMEVLYMRLPGGDPVAVTDSRQPTGDVDWTPDSRSLLFTPEEIEKSELCRVPIGPGGKPACETAAQMGKGLIQFSASRGAGPLVLAHAQPDLNIWGATLDSAQGVSSWQRLIGSPGQDAYPVYSPDGRKLAFISDRSGDDQLWVRDAGGERQLTFGDLKPGNPSWTAGADVLVFPALRKRRLYRIGLDDHRPDAISVGDVGAHTAVSPDGSWVFLAHRFYIMRAPASGGTPTQLTDQGGFPLRLSPDGKWIYYVRHRYSSEIWRLRRSDAYTERVTNRLRSGCWGCWAMGAGGLLYIPTGDGETARLERLDLTTGEVRKLGGIPGHLQPPLGGMLTLSPDGRSLAAVVAEPGTGDIRLLERASSKIRP